jgi:hypothetical protein
MHTHRASGMELRGMSATTGDRNADAMLISILLSSWLDFLLLEEEGSGSMPKLQHFPRALALAPG